MDNDSLRRSSRQRKPKEHFDPSCSSPAKIPRLTGTGSGSAPTNEYGHGPSSVSELAPTPTSSSGSADHHDQEMPQQQGSSGSNIHVSHVHHQPEQVHSVESSKIIRGSNTKIDRITLGNIIKRKKKVILVTNLEALPSIDSTKTSQTKFKCICTKEKALAENLPDRILKRQICMALSVFKGHRVKCHNHLSPEPTPKLIMTPSSHLKLKRLCSQHIGSMKQHECCPICGIFCLENDPRTQYCKDAHRFHNHEELNIPKPNECPHCGITLDIEPCQPSSYDLEPPSGLEMVPVLLFKNPDAEEIEFITSSVKSNNEIPVITLEDDEPTVNELNEERDVMISTGSHNEEQKINLCEIELLVQNREEIKDKSKDVVALEEELIGNHVTAKKEEELVANQDTPKTEEESIANHVTPKTEEELTRNTEELIANAHTPKNDELIENQVIPEIEAELIGNQDTQNEEEELIGNQDTQNEEELIGNQDTQNEEEEELIGNQDTQNEEEEELIGNQDTQNEEEEELIGNQHTQNDEELIGNQDTRKPEEELIRNQDTSKTEELNTNQDTQEREEELIGNTDPPKTKDIIGNQDTRKAEEELITNADISKTEKLIANADIPKTEELIGNQDTPMQEELISNTDTPNTEEELIGDPDTRNTEGELIGNQDTQEVEEELIAIQYASSVEQELIADPDTREIDEELISNSDTSKADEEFIGNQVQDTGKAEEELISNDDTPKEAEELIGNQGTQLTEQKLTENQDTQLSEQELTENQDTQLSEQELVENQDTENAEEDFIANADTQLTEEELISNLDTGKAEEELIADPDTLLTEEELIADPNTQLSEEELISNLDTGKAGEKLIANPDTGKAEEELIANPDTGKVEEELIANPDTGNAEEELIVNADPQKTEDIIENQDTGKAEEELTANPDIRKIEELTTNPDTSKTEEELIANPDTGKTDEELTANPDNSKTEEELTANHDTPETEPTDIGNDNIKNDSVPNTDRNGVTSPSPSVPLEEYVLIHENHTSTLSTLTLLDEDKGKSQSVQPENTQNNATFTPISEYCAVTSEENEMSQSSTATTELIPVADVPIPMEMDMPLQFPHQLPPMPFQEQIVPPSYYASLIEIRNRTEKIHFNTTLRLMEDARDLYCLGRTQNLPNVEEAILNAYDSQEYALLYAILLDTEAYNMQFSSRNGKTLLHLAAEDKNMFLIVVLLTLFDDEDDLGILDGDGMTPLLRAIKEDQPDIATYLVSMGCNPFKEDSNGDSPLHYALKHKRLNSLKALVPIRSDFITQQHSRTGLLPIMIALEHNLVEEAIYLISDCHSDLRLRDPAGNTALHWCAFGDCLRLVDLIIENGGHWLLSVKNNLDETPFDVAVNQCNDRMTCVLGHKNRKYGRLRVVCDDVTMGQEKFPISCINEFDNEILKENFSYIKEIDQDSKTNLLKYLPTQCRREIKVCWCFNPQRAIESPDRFTYCPLGKLCTASTEPPAMIYECNVKCRCNPSKCQNRIVQNGVNVPLQVFRKNPNTTENNPNRKPWGLQALAPIPKGTFICEWVGEITLLTDSEIGSQFSALVVQTNYGITRQVGPFHYGINSIWTGNITHYIDHSLEPNVGFVYVSDEVSTYLYTPKIAIFATKDIESEEEITMNYCNPHISY